MKKKLKGIFAALAVAFLLLQLTNPARTNPPVVHDMIASNQPPAEVAAMLRASCYDCHTHETTWPFYSRIAPSSWLVVGDVNEGRQHLNLSDWPQDPERAAKKCERMSEAVEDGDMPPGKYTMIHVNARLTDAQKKQLTQWLDDRADQLKAAAK